ncbi:hypothetical protein BH09MYX1_BH09MYX1_61210 [soil metagenome]
MSMGRDVARQERSLGLVALRVQSFFHEIYALPPALVADAASDKLRARAPYVLETEDGSFDVEAYARAGQVTLRVAPIAHPMVRSQFRGQRRKVRDTVENGFFEVSWRGHSLEVVQLQWMSDGSSSNRTYVMAPSEAVAKEFFHAVCMFATSHVGREILVFEEGTFSKNRELFDAIRVATFDNLVLPAEAIAALRRDFLGFFEAKDAFAKYGVPWRRGALFVGPPGNGKTHTIKAILGESDKPVLYVKSLISRHATDHASVYRIFERAREAAPCFLVLEDLDAIVDDGNRSVFLNELDGFAKNDGIFTIATTNHPESLDPALVERPSRFDRTYLFPLPDLPRRLMFLERWAQKLDAEVRPTPAAVVRAAEASAGFSFAYLKEVGTATLLTWLHELGGVDAILDAQVKKLGGHVRRGDVSRVLGAVYGKTR